MEVKEGVDKAVEKPPIFDLKLDNEEGILKSLWTSQMRALIWL